MFRVKIFVGRNVSENVQIISLWLNAVVEQSLIVLHEVTQHKSAIQVGHLAAIPMVHERNRPLFPITEARSRESLRRALGIFLMNCELRIVRRRIDVVIAILVMQAEEV